MVNEGYSGYFERARSNEQVTLKDLLAGQQSCLFCLSTDWEAVFRTSSNNSSGAGSVAIAQLVVCCRQCLANLEANQHALLLAKLENLYGTAAADVWEKFRRSERVFVLR